MFAIQIFLPLRNNDGTPFPKSEFDAICQYLTELYGGVTAYVRAPASGSWQNESGEIKHDEIVVYEVLTESIERDWWGDFRKRLESTFKQDEIIIHGHAVSIL
jgi:hypothetical protein